MSEYADRNALADETEIMAYTIIYNWLDSHAVREVGAETIDDMATEVAQWISEGVGDIVYPDADDIPF